MPSADLLNNNAIEFKGAKGIIKFSLVQVSKYGGLFAIFEKFRAKTVVIVFREVFCLVEWLTRHNGMQKNVG